MKRIVIQTLPNIAKGTIIEGDYELRDGVPCVKGIPMGSTCSLCWNGLAPKDMTPFQLGEFLKYRAAGLPYVVSDIICVTTNKENAWTGIAKDAPYSYHDEKRDKRIHEIRKEMERLASELKQLEN